jgi:hypothetical protein
MADVIEIDQQRAGCTIDVSGKQMPLGWIPQELVGLTHEKDSVSYRALAAHTELAESITRRHHNWNMTLVEAKLRNVDPASEMPEVTAQVALTEADATRVEALTKEVASLEALHTFRTDRLKPFDPPKDLMTQQSQAELRALLRSSDEKTRLTLLERPNYQQAALLGEPELSGLQPIQHDTLKHVELEKRRPDELRELAIEKQILEAARLSLAAATEATSKAKIRLGVRPKLQPMNPAPSRRWR